MALNVNYYRTNFTDKIERVTSIQGDRQTVNAGKALHWGVETSVNAMLGGLDAAASFTFARNRWQEMTLDEIFSESAEDIVDKVVPFSPELMANGAVGYNLGKLRIGLSVNWWDEYYGSYTNEYTLADGKTVEDAKLPFFMTLNADVSYTFDLGAAGLKLRLDFNNLLNRENYANAAYSADYNRNDDLAGTYYMYVMQAPLFNTFLTTELTF